MEELPVGFNPTDEELIIDYLRPKLAGAPETYIHTFDIYRTEPYLVLDFDRGYCFTRRVLDYDGGRSHVRAAGRGDWILFSEAEPVVDSDGVPIGTKTSLAYHEEKSGMNSMAWIMDEYECDGAGDWVLCRINWND